MVVMAPHDRPAAVAAMVMVVAVHVVPVDDPMPMVVMVVPTVNGDAARTDMDMLGGGDTRRDEECGSGGDDGQLQLHSVAPCMG